MSGTAVLLAGGWELLVFPHPEGMADHRHAGPLAHGGLVWAKRMPRAMMELCGQRCWGSALRWRLWGAGPEGSKMAVSHYVTTGGGRPAPQHEDQVVGGQWLPFPGEDWLICKMAAREQERLLLTLWRVAAGGDEKGHEPSILLRLNHSRDSREQPHHLHFLGDGHGVGGAAMRRRGGGKVPARAARGRRRAAGPAQRAPWPWAGGARPSAGPTLPRGLSSSPRPFYLYVIYLFISAEERVWSARRETEGGGCAGRGGRLEERERKKKRRPPSVRPRDFPCRRAQGRAVPVPAGEEGGGGRGGGGAGGAPAPPPPRGRRGSRRCAPELLLVTPAPPPASLPLLASDSAHSQPRSLSFCKTQFTQQRERAGEVERERETARRGAQSRNPAWLRGTFTR